MPNQALVNYTADQHTFTLWALLVGTTAPLLLITPKSCLGNTEVGLVFQNLEVYN